MIKVLSIGNSYSQDAQRYLHKLSVSEGEEIKCVNLYIGGCSLYQHYINMLDDRPNYSLEYNGEETGFYVSIKQALISDNWDYVTIQQFSRLSCKYDEYTPYASKLAEYVRLYAPKAKLYMHQTWAYEQNTDRLNVQMGFADNHDMLSALTEAYTKTAADISADGIIPSGNTIMYVLDNGIEKIHRDGSHIDLGIGRYLLALTWYMTLTGKRTEKLFEDFDVEVSREDACKIKKLVEDYFKM